MYKYNLQLLVDCIKNNIYFDFIKINFTSKVISFQHTNVIQKKHTKHYKTKLAKVTYLSCTSGDSLNISGISVQISFNLWQIIEIYKQVQCWTANETAADTNGAASVNGAASSNGAAAASSNGASKETSPAKLENLTYEEQLCLRLQEEAR